MPKEEDISMYGIPMTLLLPDTPGAHRHAFVHPSPASMDKENRENAACAIPREARTATTQEIDHVLVSSPIEIPMTLKNKANPSIYFEDGNSDVTVKYPMV
jgi:hypothetical protein